MDNIIKTENRTVIICGGNPLPGCPESYNEAYKWANYANKEKDIYGEPKWSFDCGFKLDFDGTLLDVSSRFYPPKTHYGEKWHGTVDFSILNEAIKIKEFECDSLDELRDQVESYVKKFTEFLNSNLIEKIADFDNE